MEFGGPVYLNPFVAIVEIATIKSNILDLAYIATFFCRNICRDSRNRDKYLLYFSE